jgi:hypothetical protein
VPAQTTSRDLAERAERARRLLAAEEARHADARGRYKAALLRLRELGARGRTPADIIASALAMRGAAEARAAAAASALEAAIAAAEAAVRPKEAAGV